MSIYTSRFSNPELKTGKYYVIGITLCEPKFSLGYEKQYQCFLLAPERSMWGKSHEEFSRLYRAKLEKIGALKIRAMLASFEKWAEGKDIVLTCFEDVRDPSQHCHRIDFAEWVAERLGMSIIELKDDSKVRYKEKKAVPKKLQMLLF